MEIERKWLLHDFPDEIIPSKIGEFHTAYLSISPEVRIRRISWNSSNAEEYFMTVKSQDIDDQSNKKNKKSSKVSVREEVEIPISMTDYYRILDIVGKPSIKKIYHKYEQYEYPIEISLVDNTYYIAEVEFDSVDAATNYSLPFKYINVIREVTKENYFRMANYWFRSRLLESK